MDQPLEARCDGCKQTRPVFLYEPDHNAHALPVPCEWCDRDKQPLLCVRCWGNEREREENRPVSAEEVSATAFLYQLLGNNARYVERVNADKATCEAIARATEESES